MDRSASIDRYAAGFDAVVAALDGITAAELDHRPAPGEWSPRQVVHHLADSEARSFIRLRQLLAEDGGVIQAYDQDRWAERLPYDLPVEVSLPVVQAVRGLSLATVRTLEAAGDTAWDRAATHPEHDEPYTLDLWLALYAEHPHDHAAQIRAAREHALR